MTQEETKEQEERKLTPEEIEARSEELMQFYKERVSLLDQQVAYERLITEIDELRMRSLIAQVRFANLMADAPKEGEKTAEVKK